MDTLFGEGAWLELAPCSDFRLGHGGCRGLIGLQFTVSDKGCEIALIALVAPTEERIQGSNVNVNSALHHGHTRNSHGTINVIVVHGGGKAQSFSDLTLVGGKNLAFITYISQAGGKGVPRLLVGSDCFRGEICGFVE